MKVQTTWATVNSLIMDHVKGEIVRASKRSRSKGYHFILVWKDFNEGMDFTGTMLTSSTSNKYLDNVPFDKSHIQEGNEFEWRDSYFVNRLFIKIADWGPFTKVGELTASGSGYVEKNLQDVLPVPFELYLAERRSA